MRKTVYVLREVWRMIKMHKMYFIAPTLICLAMIAFLVYYVGPAAMVSFLYAGI